MILSPCLSGRVLAWLALLTLAVGCLPQEEPPPCGQFECLRIYQIMVEAFIDGDPQRNHGAGYGPSHHRGDLRGVIQALPHIKSLGVNAIWLTPIFAAGGDPRLAATGYFPVDYFRIDPRLGSLEEARELVRRAHALGLYVFLDGVFGHHGGDVAPSPQGRLPVGGPNPVDYPASLEFYREVATYWIDELEIDGWRLDQAYQVPVEAWQTIRAAVQETCNRRRQAGKEWGTLGYMVAEVWSGEREIAAQAYGTADAPGLPSAFDFPLRYRLVQALAVEESGKGKLGTEVLHQGLATRQTYPAHARPNLMLGNHDLVRFGDLLQRAGYGGPETAQYWRRHGCALSFLAACSGPITLYYGEEIGAEVPGFAARVEEDCVAQDRCDDHVARSSGRIADLNPRERALKEHAGALLRLRASHPALWRGERLNLIAAGNLYADLKTAGGDRLLYVLNISTRDDTLKVEQQDLGGRRLQDALDGERFTPDSGRYQIPLPGLTARFLKVE